MRAQTAKDHLFRARRRNVFRFSSAVATLGIAATFMCAGQRAIAAETPNQQPTAKPAAEKAAPAKPEPISVDDYFAAILKPGIAANDQAAFAKKHVGANVTWTGYVRTLSKNLSPDGTLYMLMLKQKVADEEGKPNGLFLARFTAEAEKELTALRRDQKVTVTGTLTVDQNPALPTLDGAKLSGS